MLLYRRSFLTALILLLESTLNIGKVVCCSGAEFCWIVSCLAVVISNAFVVLVVRAAYDILCIHLA
jgi:hypothetical protein